MPYYKMTSLVMVRCIPAFPAHGRQRQEDLKFKTSMGSVMRPCLQKTNNNNK
jgi:hypothetical protein